MTVTSPRRVVFLSRLFQRSRIARYLFLFAVFPPVWLADKARRVNPPAQFTVGLQWARTGKGVVEPAIRTSDIPATVNRPRRSQ